MFLCHYTRPGHHGNKKTDRLTGLPGEVVDATLQVACTVRVECIAQAVAHQVDGEDD